MLHIHQEKPSEAGAREALLDAAYGPVRFTKPSQRLRAGRAPADDDLLSADAGHLHRRKRAEHDAACGRRAERKQ